MRFSHLFSQILHFTLTESPGNRINRFEPHLGQIGQARMGFISALLVWCQIGKLWTVCFFR